jgi:hypothetical protein
MSEERIGTRGKLMAELKSMLLVFVYLVLVLGSFAIYRRVLLAEYRIPFFQYGYSILESLVLAKVIVFGRFLRLGERFSSRPLIVSTLYKALWFSLLILSFSILEHLIVGWLHGKTIGVIFTEILDEGVWEILARSLVKVLALLPLLAIWEIGRVLGEGKLFELFFTNRTWQPKDSKSAPFDNSLGPTT